MCTHICMSEVHTYATGAYMHSAAVIKKLPQKSVRELTLSILFRLSLVPPCTIITVLEERSFLGGLQLLIW